MKRVTSILTAMLLAFALVGCSGGASSSGGQSEAAVAEGGAARTDLKLAINSEPQTLDPQYTFDQMGLRIANNICDTLMDFDDSGDFVPRLVTEYDISEDGLTYTLTLQEGVSYQSGRPFNADSVIANIERCKESPFTEDRVNMITSMTAVDELTLELTLDEPFFPFLWGITSIWMIDTDALAEVGDEAFGRAPVGTGPYMMDSWSSGEKLILKANPDYYGGEAPIKELEFKIVPDSSSMIIALENREIDVAMDIASVDVDTVKADESLNYQTTATSFVEFLYYNCENEPFNDVRVRNAIELCIDKQAIIDVAFNGHASIADQSITPAYQGYLQDYSPTQRDIELAKQLLADAGYPDGFSCKISSMDGFRRQAAESIQANLAEIGIDASVELLEFGTLLDIGAAGEFELYMMELGTTNYDTYLMMMYNYYTPLRGGGGNYGRTGGPELDKLIEAYPRSLNTDAADQIYADMVDILKAESYCVPLFTRESNIAADSALNGVYANPIGLVQFKNLSW